MSDHFARKLFTWLAVVTAVYSIFSVVLMSDFGQFFALPKSWIVTYYRLKWLFGGLNILLLAALWYLHLDKRVAPRWLLIGATVGVISCILGANVINAFLFPTRQHAATYVSVPEADAVLEDDQVVYVLEINGDVRGYPQDHLELPHVAGGEQVAMTYCGPSSLPVAIGQDLGHGESDLSVMAQVNNNLILRDHESGELIQQITATTEFGGKPLTVYPNTMMKWSSFKELYPDGQVFIYDFDRLIDPVIQWAFAMTLKIQNDRDKGAAFPTVSMDDDRLNPKERVWGYNAGDYQIAFTRSFAQNNAVHKFEFKGEHLVLVYDAEHDIVTLFSRTRNGQEVAFESIDFRGQTEEVRLEQKALHNGV